MPDDTFPLPDALPSTADDLAHNTAGALSPRQRAALDAGFRAWASTGAILLFGEARTRTNALREDLAAGRVVPAVGAVRWYRDARWSHRASGRWGAYLDGTPEGSEPAMLHGALPPGTYTFYLLPRSQFVVGAVATGASPADTAAYREHYESVLLTLQGISSDDLAANRAGRVSETQQRWIARAARVDAFWVLTLGAGGLAAVLGALLIAVPNADRPAAERHAYLAAWVILVALTALAGALLARARARARGAGIASVSGVLERAATFGYSRNNNDEDRAYYACSVTVAGRAFDLVGREALYAALAPGLPHRVYFDDRYGALLAIEAA